MTGGATGESAQVCWARETGPDVPTTARRILEYLAEIADADTGTVSVTLRTVSRHLRRSTGRTFDNVQELELAGLIVADKDPERDLRRNVYTLAGAATGWQVTVPLVPYNRHGFYQLHRRIAQLEGMLISDSGTGIEGRYEDSY